MSSEANEFGALGSGRSSIARRLSRRLFKRLFGTLVSLDVLICLIVAAAAVVYCERVAAEAYADRTNRTGVTISSVPDGKSGFVYFGEPVIRFLPVSTDDAGRRVEIDAQYGGLFPVMGELKADYVLYFGGGADGASEVRVHMGGFVVTVARAFLLLIIIEIIMLIVKATKDRRFVRRILEPITQLAKTARSLGVGGGERAPARTASDTDRVAALVRGLDGIDAARLDTRIPLDGVQRELRELAVAINGMLDRITESYRAQARFVSDASHELRTPISVIAGYANLLDRWGKNDAKTLDESISAIKSEAESMRSLVEQLLFLARSDSDAVPLDLERFDLAEVADNVFAETGMTCRTHNFVSKPGSAPVYADRQLVKQLIRVFVDNSIKNTDSGGTITSHAYTEGGYSKISITDDGIGIAPEALPHIFDRFTRADESRARATGGAGLGLSIALRIARRHGGGIEAISRVGIGTRMTLWIPEAEQLTINNSVC